MAPAHVITFVAGFLLIPVFANSTLRIWGGEETDKNSFQYTASMRYDNAHVCGGSIIGARSILTAAHCLKENGSDISANRLTVRVGSTNIFAGGQIYAVAETFIHPSYAGEKNDIAVLRLQSTIKWTSRIQKINVATNSLDEPAVGDLVTVAGWGQQSANSSYKLHSMALRVASEEVCLDGFSRKENSHICLTHNLAKGSCKGDAGNGAVHNQKIIGVSSFVVGACGARYPEVFSRVSHFVSWLQTVTV